MTTLTLVAVLQMNMKTSKTSIEEATLIETALTACFGYWAFLSCFIYCAVYVCSSYINTIQVVTSRVEHFVAFGKLVFSITSRMLIILMEHIEIKNSLDS